MSRNGPSLATCTRAGPRPAGGEDSLPPTCALVLAQPPGTLSDVSHRHCVHCPAPSLRHGPRPRPRVLQASTHGLAHRRPRPRCGSARRLRPATVQLVSSEHTQAPGGHSGPFRGAKCEKDVLLPTRRAVSVTLRRACQAKTAGGPCGWGSRPEARGAPPSSPCCPHEGQAKDTQ